MQCNVWISQQAEHVFRAIFAWMWKVICVYFGFSLLRLNFLPFIIGVMFDYQPAVPSSSSPVPKPLSKMADESEVECPKKLLSQRIQKANGLLKRCDTLEKTIEGLQKLRRKITAELKFLTSVSLFVLFSVICVQRSFGNLGLHPHDKAAMLGDKTILFFFT